MHDFLSPVSHPAFAMARRSGAYLAARRYRLSAWPHSLSQAAIPTKRTQKISPDLVGGPIFRPLQGSQTSQFVLRKAEGRFCSTSGIEVATQLTGV